jgi:hypothetical protein
MMIKPEDISDEAFDEMNGDYYSDFGMDKEDFAAILNAAIEAGVVSPPCWVVRDGFGDIVTHRRAFTAKAFASYESGHRPEYAIEHWKGQVE